MVELSIVIVSWNTRDELHGCLSSIEQNVSADTAEVVVVDNGSRDGTQAMVRSSFPRMTMIDNHKNLGFAKGCNIGAGHTKRPFILFLNPDTLVPRNTVDEMLSFMKAHPHLGALGCRMKSPPGVAVPDADAHTLGLQWFPSPLTELVSILLLTDRTTQLLRSYLPYKDPSQSGSVSKLYGGCLMVRRSAFQDVGCFDERFFMYAEDGDLSKRLIGQGWGLYYLAETHVIHSVGGSSQNAGSQWSTLMKCESMSKLMKKYYGNRGLFGYRLVVLIGAILRIAALHLIRATSYILRVNYCGIAGSLLKYRAMLGWSLGFKKPVIPG